MVVELLDAGSHISVDSLLNALHQADWKEEHEEPNEELLLISGTDIIKLLFDRRPMLRLEIQFLPDSSRGTLLRVVNYFSEKNSLIFP